MGEIVLNMSALYPLAIFLADPFSEHVLRFANIWVEMFRLVVTIANIFRTLFAYANMCSFLANID